MWALWVCKFESILYTPRDYAHIAFLEMKPIVWLLRLLFLTRLNHGGLLPATDRQKEIIVPYYSTQWLIRSRIMVKEKEGGKAKKQWNKSSNCAFLTQTFQTVLQMSPSLRFTPKAENPGCPALFVAKTFDFQNLHLV